MFLCGKLQSIRPPLLPQIIVIYLGSCQMVTFRCTAGYSGRCPKLTRKINAYLVVKLFRGICTQGYAPFGLMRLNVFQVNS